MAIEFQQDSSKDLKKTQTTWSNINISFLSSKKISSKERVFLFQQILLLLQTGTPLYAGLCALKKQTEKPAMRDLISDLIATIDEGKSFSYALSKFPNVFTSTQINLISASEEGGFMQDVLKQILEMEERREKLRSTLISAISYPSFLAIFSIAVVVFILIVIFPKFSELFTKIHDQLPITTKSLMWTSEVLTNNWIVIITIVFGFIFLVYRWSISASGKTILDTFKLKFPLLKTVYTQLYLVQSFRVMSLSLGNGVSIVDTLFDCKNTVQNSVYRNFIKDVELKVQEGSGISAGFTQADFIPPLVKQMMTTGEETGNLATVMGKISDHYESELLKYLQTVSKLAEPIMLLIMGGLVGIIVSSLILPIFQLSRAVH